MIINIYNGTSIEDLNSIKKGIIDVKGTFKNSYYYSTAGFVFFYIFFIHFIIIISSFNRLSTFNKSFYFNFKLKIIRELILNLFKYFRIRFLVN